MKTEAPSQVAAIPKVIVTPRQAAKNCTWGPHCPIYKNEEEHGEEDWDGNLQNLPIDACMKKKFQNSGKINKQINKYWYSYQSLLLSERESPKTS